MKKLIGWAVVVVAIIGAAFLGVNFPVPPPPVDVGVVIERSGVGQPIKFDRAVTFAQPVTMASDATVGDDLVVTGDLTVSGTSTVTADPTTLAVGGGFGGGYAAGSGCTIIADGSLLCDTAIYSRGTLGVTGAVTTTTTADIGGTLTTPRADIGGGWSAGGGGSGCTVYSTGNLGCDGTGYFLGTLGVTGAVTVTGNTDLSGTLQYGANDLYAVGHASSGKAIVAGIGTVSAEGYVAVAHGLTTVDAVLTSLCTIPSATFASASAIITGTTVTVHSWRLADNTWTGTTGNVCYQVIGTR